jgi:RNA polymerase sigma-70 factor (ECF subfamily)
LDSVGFLTRLAKKGALRGPIAVPTMTNERSSVLLQKFLSDPRNEEQFGQFVAKYQPRIKALCLEGGLQEADADDVTANILLVMWSRGVFDSFVFQGKAAFRGWLARVALNACNTFFRERKRDRSAWSVGDEDAQATLDQVASNLTSGITGIFEEDMARVNAARERVSQRVEERTWQAFCLLVDDERTVAEVASELSMTRTAVWQALSRVKRMLRAEIGELHEGA